MLDLLARLTATPVRRGGILDIPFDDYVEDVAWPEVGQLLGAYVRAQARPTLRSVLVDPRFRRWVDVAGGGPIRKKLEEELAIVSGVVEEEEHILDDEPLEPLATASGAPAAVAHDPLRALREWAEGLGVEARLRDPSGVIMQRVPAGELRSVLRNTRRATVADLLGGTFDTASWRLAARDRQVLASHAEAHVRDAGERVLAARREEARVEALGHAPEGDGARELLAAVDAALAKISRPISKGAWVTGASLERRPVRIEVRASLVPDRDGRPRTITITLALEDWRLTPLETMIRSDAKEGRTADVARLVLGRVRRILRDPRDDIHPALVAYLNEPPWTRVLANLDALVARRAAPTRRPEARIEWQVTAGQGQAVHVGPLVGESDGQPGGREALRTTSVDAIVHGQVGGVSARDEAVARALRVTGPIYSYGYAHDGRAAGSEGARERSFRALSLLVGHDNVRGRAGVRLSVIDGPLGVALEQEDGGYRFVFDVGGEHLDARELRASLDAAGYLLHVDVPQG